MYCKMRKSLLTSLVVLCVLSFVALTGAFFTTSHNVRADVTVLNAEEFSMQGGAQVKLSTDKALRFVTVADKDYLDGIITENGVENVKVATLITKKSTVSGKSFVKESLEEGTFVEVIFKNAFENLTANVVGDNYVFNACIYNVKDANIDQAFSARSYLEVKGDVIGYTAFDEENNSRDMVTVVKAALNDEESGLTKENIATLLGAEFSAKIEEVMVDDQEVANVVTAISNLPVFADFEESKYAYVFGARTLYNALNGNEKAAVTNYDKLTALETAIAEKYDIFTINDMSKNLTNSTDFASDAAIYHHYQSQEDATFGFVNIMWNNDGGNFTADFSYSTDLSGYKLYFILMSRDVNTNMLSSVYGSTSTSPSLAQGVWTTKTIDGKDGTQETAKLSVGINTSTGKSNYMYYMAPVFALKVKDSVKAQAVVDAISALPAAEDLTGSDYAYIRGAKLAYEALSSSAQACVTNYETLTALETAYNAKYEVKMLVDMTSNVFTKSDYGSSLTETISVEANATFGNVFKVVTAKASTICEYSPANSVDASGYDNVYAYIYNGGVSNKTTHLFYDKGASATAKVGEWSLLTIDASIMTQVKLVVEGADGTYYLSPVFAVRENESIKVQAVEDLIDNIPASTDAVAIFDGECIIAAYNAYSDLSASAKSAVDGDKVTLLNEIYTYYSARYGIICDVSDYWLKPFSSATTAVGYVGENYLSGCTGVNSFEEDATYGTVVKLTAPADWTQETIKGNWSANFVGLKQAQDFLKANTDIDSVEFYIKSSSSAIEISTNGKTTFKSYTLTAEAWNKIVMTREEVLGSNCGVRKDWVAGSSAYYTFSNIFYTTTFGKLSGVIALQSNLPATVDGLTMLDGEKIYAAYNAYNALTDELKTAYGEGVTSGDYKDVVAYKAAYDAKWIMVFDYNAKNPFSSKVDGTWGNAIAYSVEQDDVYGTVIGSVQTKSNGNTKYVFDVSSVKSLINDDVASVVLYTYYYNAGDDKWTLRFDTGAGYSSETINFSSIKETWTEIVFTAEQFNSLVGNLFTMYGTFNLKFSNFYLIKKTQSFDEILSFAEKLPATTDALTMLDGEVVYAAYNAYNALSTSAKATYGEGVTSGDYKDVVAYKTAYDAKWIMVYDAESQWMSHANFASYSKWDSYRAVASVESTNDEVYGTVNAVTFTKGNGTGEVYGHGICKFDINTLVQAFKDNPTATAVKFYFKATPNDWGFSMYINDTKTSLEKSGLEWKEITLTRDQIVNGDNVAVTDGVMGDTSIADRGETYYFSNFYLVK